MFNQNMPPPDAQDVEEWNMIQCAKWLGVPPWELGKQSAAWVNKALYYMAIENEVQEMRMHNGDRSE